MGYEPGIAPEPVTILTREVSDELMQMGDVRAEYRIISDIRLDHEEKSVGVGDVFFFVRPIVYRQIKDADEVALFICTAGPAIGELSRQNMKEGDLLRGYIYDVIGSEVVEAAADRMQEELRAAAAARGENDHKQVQSGILRTGTLQNSTSCSDSLRTISAVSLLPNQR